MTTTLKGNWKGKWIHSYKTSVIFITTKTVWYGKGWSIQRSNTLTKIRTQIWHNQTNLWLSLFYLFIYFYNLIVTTDREEIWTEKVLKISEDTNQLSYKVLSSGIVWNNQYICIYIYIKVKTSCSNAWGPAMWRSKLSFSFLNIFH